MYFIECKKSEYETIRSFLKYHEIKYSEILKGSYFVIKDETHALKVAGKYEKKIYKLKEFS